MLLILEIILTIVAWNRGWGAKALIPIGASLVIGFAIGFFIGLGGGHITAGVVGIVRILDFIAMGIIAFMAFVKPVSANETETKETKEVEQEESK